MYTLYYAPGTCALASHITLEEAGAPYQAVKLDFRNNEQRSDAYLKINSKGRVPALATPDGVLSETPAILAFIAQKFPQAGLAPTDPYRFAVAQSFNSYLCSTVHVSHAHRMRGHRWVDDNPAAIEAMQRKVPANMRAAFELVEQQLLAGPWVLGNVYSVCDPYLFTLARWLEGDGVDIAAFPKVNDHLQRMNQRPAVIKVLAAQ